MRSARLVFFAVSLFMITANALAGGLSINIPLVGRVTGAGGTLFVTAIDVTNNTNAPVAIDFYFDGINSSTGQTVAINGSVTEFGLERRQNAPVAALSNQHYEDFVDALVQSSLLPASFRDQGVLGSLLFVFNGYNKRGQGAATARFYNALSGGYVGVALKGHEISENEPRKLVGTIRDTRGNAGVPQVYPNLFLNNTGLTPDGVYTPDSVTVRLNAVSPRTGQAVGTTLDVPIPSGLTVNVGQTFQALNVSNATEDTIIVYATVISGSAAIEAVVSQVDAVTKDGAAFEMSRADF